MKDGYNMLRRIIILTGFILSIIAVSVHADRIKDVATLAGVRDNQLVGYGLVVGLNGTGDRAGTKFTEQSFSNMLMQMGINIPPGTKLNSKNIAAVMVTANLSSFMKKGQTIDVNVSSIGDSQSLRGGTLLMTPLKGADGRVYAMSQGNIVVVGLSVTNDDNNVTVNVPSGGRIANGATVEADIPNPFYFSQTLTLNLRTPDFTTSRRMSDAINQTMGPGTAHPVDAASVEITAPRLMADRVDYMSVLENIEFTPAEAPAKIIVNARTGTIVINRLVRVKPAAVSHGNLVVTISQNPYASQPNAFAGGRTVIVPQTDINVEQTNVRNFVFKSGPTLQDIVRVLNTIGAGPGDTIAILEALKEAGAVNATIIVI